MPQKLNSKDRRYTLSDTDAVCKQLAGVTHWDLDVAAEPKSRLGSHYFCAPGQTVREDLGCLGEDGLKQSWLHWATNQHTQGQWNIWGNVPFSNAALWVEKAWREYHDFVTKPVNPEIKLTIAILIPSNRTEQPFWQKLVEPFRDRRGNCFRTHFLATRVRYGQPKDPKGKKAGSPPFGSVLLVWCSKP